MNESQLIILLTFENTECIAIAHEPIAHKPITVLDKNKDSLHRSRCDWQCNYYSVQNAIWNVHRDWIALLISCSFPPSNWPIDHSQWYFLQNQLWFCVVFQCFYQSTRSLVISNPKLFPRHYAGPSGRHRQKGAPFAPALLIFSPSAHLS